MNHLILIRHSQPEIDPAVPAKRWQLSDEGIRRCHLLVEHLADFHIRQVFASTEPKAQQTAAIIAKHLSVPTEIAEDLHEHDRSNETGWSTPEQFQATIRELFEKYDQLIYGLETADQAYQRFARAVNRLVEQNPDQDLTIVSHGTVMTLFTSRTNPIEPFAFWRRLGLPCMLIFSLQALELIQAIERVE
jgi:broad specificity phosphatase PhoE